MSTYTGIDYGLGRANIDADTGIRYGVISQGSINPDALADLEPYYGEPTCGKCGNPAVETSHESIPESADWLVGSHEYACLNCQWMFDSDEAYPDEPYGFTYEADGYSLTDCLDSDIFVLKSPYYTYAQFCSPCVPGAGNLDNPTANGPKTFCLGHDWFEDGKAPYTVYSVETGEEVKP